MTLIMGIEVVNRKILLDVHTHTIASGHAYSCLQEMVKAAADKGLEVLGITVDGPRGEHWGIYLIKHHV